MNNKGAGETAQADLHLCCSHMAKTGFLMMWLIYIYICMMALKCFNIKKLKLHVYIQNHYFCGMVYIFFEFVRFYQKL